MALTKYTSSADYLYLDEALRDQWTRFIELRAEMSAFVPKPIEAFADYRATEIERLRVLNPSHALEQLAAMVDRNLEVGASPAWQFHARFDKRHMITFITVTTLSHALCEALINAVLAVGLANADTPELFPLLERADIKQKWLHGPKSFFPSYRFPEGTALQETLVVLARQRNVLAHHKIDIEVEGEKIFDGSRIERHGYQKELGWISRFFSLPYDLADFVGRTVKAGPMFFLYDRQPIEVAPEHAFAGAG